MSKITIKDKDGKIIKKINADINKTLLSQITESGLEINSACHMGICGACMMTIESGDKNIIKNKKTQPNFLLGRKEIMTCIGGIKKGKGDVVLRKMY